jgi:hypothetical protein
MVTMIGYGPEAFFSDKPKNPTWTTRVRYKSTASMVMGMGAMMGASGQPQQQAQQPAQAPPPKRKRGFGLGDVIRGATGIPVPN